MNKCLILIDCQYDFITGSLAVSGARDIMDALTRYVEKYGENYKDIIFTMDQHPITHCSFKDIEYTGREPGQWPRHCVQYTTGAAIYDPLLQAAIELQKRVPDLHISFIEKGKSPIKDEYSAFDKDNKENKLKFFNIVDLRGINQIDTCGIVSEICVKNTIESLVEMGFSDKLNVLEEFCPSFDDGKELHEFLVKNNIKFS